MKIRPSTALTTTGFVVAAGISGYYAFDTNPPEAGTYDLKERSTDAIGLAALVVATVSGAVCARRTRGFARFANGAMAAFAGSSLASLAVGRQFAALDQH